MAQRGDICSIMGKEGTWVALEPYPSSTGHETWRCMRLTGNHEKGPVKFTTAALTNVRRTTFTVGQEVRWEGWSGCVITQIEELHITVTLPAKARRVDLNEIDTVAFGVGSIAIEVGLLVAENWRSLEFEEV